MTAPETTTAAAPSLWNKAARLLAALRYDLSWRFAQPGRFRRHVEQAMMRLSHGVCMFDAQARLLLANEEFCHIYRMPMHTLHIGMTFRDMLAASCAVGNYPGRAVEEVWRERKAFIDRREPGTFVQELGDGRLIAILHQPLPDGGWLATYEDVTERRRAEERIRFLAMHDALTGLANQSALRARVQQLAHEPGPASLVLLDLDRFKDANDDLGHAAGDCVLQEVAARLRACATQSDLVARRGGDEFALLLGGPHSHARAACVADSLVQAIERPFAVEGHTLRLSASVGVALYAGDGSCTDELLCNADLALYQAKAEGGECVRHHSAELRRTADRARAYDGELRRALQDGEFELFYQPQYHLRDGALIGAEALLRWRHPVDGLLVPAAFIAALESRAISAEVGQWVMHTACAQAAAWRAAGAPGFRMAVNLFGTQLRTRNLLEDVGAALSATALPAEALELEITENILLRHDDAALAPLHALRALGVCLSFDDYGTGYASLSMLKRVPISRLKIDKSFVRGMCVSAQDAAVVRVILDLGRSFGFAVIAEGVATEEQARRLHEEGCVEAQGYLYGRPMPAAEFTARFGLGARHAAPAPAHAMAELA